MRVSISQQNAKKNFIFSLNSLWKKISCSKRKIIFLWTMSFSSLFLFSFLFPTITLGEKIFPPRFASLKSNEINERVGPGSNYPVELVYSKAGLPIEIIAEFDNWRKIRDKEGEEGWVHKSMLCSKRNGIIQFSETLIYSADDLKSKALARLEPGVIVSILKCRGEWCQIRIFDFKGWIRRAFLWGVYPQETIG